MPAPKWKIKPTTCPLRLSGITIPPSSLAKSRWTQPSLSPTKRKAVSAKVPHSPATTAA
ncbi:hypothetical protein D3C72_2081900 [compost metagenome]